MYYVLSRHVLQEMSLGPQQFLSYSSKVQLIYNDKLSGHDYTIHREIALGSSGFHYSCMHTNKSALVILPLTFVYQHERE